MKEVNLNKKIKNYKTAGSILSVLIFFCFVVAVVAGVGAYVTPSAENADYPDGQLSQSVFEHQNNEYVNIEELGMVYSICDGHYTYDMYSCQDAVVGNSRFFNFSNELNIGVTVVDDSQKPINVLAKDLNEAFGITNMTAVSSNSGYRNGWEVEYYVFDALMGNDVVNGVVYIATIDEGYFLVGATAKGLTYDDIDYRSGLVFDSVHVSENWEEEYMAESESNLINITESETVAMQESSMVDATVNNMQ